LHKGHDKPQKEGLLDGINRTVKVRARFALSSAKNKMQQRALKSAATDGGDSQDARNAEVLNRKVWTTTFFVATTHPDLRGD
jgi:hypothetical protein